MKTERTGRWLAAAALALVVTMAAAVLWLGPGRSRGYTGSAANPSVASPSLGGAVRLAPAAQRAAGPTLAFAGPDGTATDLAAFHGRAVLVNLWATWCAPCVAEMPALDALAAKLDGPDFQVVTVSLDRGGSETARSWLAKNGLTHLPAYSADPAKYTDAMLPHSLLIDPQGRVAWDGLGGRPWNTAAVQTTVAALAAEAKR